MQIPETKDAIHCYRGSSFSLIEGPWKPFYHLGPTLGKRTINRANTPSILQHNVMKSKDIVMTTLVRDQSILEYTILTI